MSIVTSSHTVGHAQVDGRRYVTEIHTDHIGEAHRIEYLAPVGANYESVMSARAIRIEDELAQAEANALLDNGA